MAKRKRRAKARKGIGIPKIKSKPIKISQKSFILLTAVVAVVAIAGGAYLLYNSPSGTEELKRHGLDLSIFRDLPPLPDDFGPVKALIDGGRIRDVCERIGEEYWKQPEFYPNFIPGGVSLMLNPPENRMGIQGYGSFPSEGLVGANPGDTIRTCTFIHTSWFISTYQGLKLVPAYMDDAELSENFFSDGTKTVEQNAEENQNYFDIEIEPIQFLIEPTWGYFYNGWVKKADIVVHVSPNTPPGKYLVGVGVTAPNQDQAEEWLWEYKTIYVNAGAFGIGRPLYMIGIEVTET